MNAAGKFYGIGIGPGDPELITRKAARILTEVDWIFLPASVSGEPGFAAQIIAPLDLDPNRLRPVKLRMSRQRDTDLAAYAQAADDILHELGNGKSAAWIAEGDPLFYSTFAHVWAALRRRAPNLDMEIIPGITSIGTAAAFVGMPIAVLDERVAVVPAIYGLHNLTELLAEFATVFLLKVHGVFDRLLDELALIANPPQTFYLEKLGTPEQRLVTDLASLRGKDLPYFSLVILHRVVQESAS